MPTAAHAEAARQGACAVNSRGGLYSSGRAPPGPHRERRTEQDLKKKPRVNQELTRPPSREAGGEQDRASRGEVGDLHKS